MLAWFLWLVGGTICALRTKAVVAYLVAMEEEPTGRLGRPRRDPRSADPLLERRCRWPIDLENLGSLGQRVEQLHGPRNDAAEDVGSQLVAEPGFAQRIGRDRVQRGPGQRNASRRALREESRRG